MSFVFKIFAAVLMLQSVAGATWVPEVEGYCPVPKEIFAFEDQIVFNESGVFYLAEDEAGRPFEMTNGTLAVLLFSGEEEVLVELEFLAGDEQGPEAILTVDGSKFTAPCFYGIPN